MPSDALPGNAPRYAGAYGPPAFIAGPITPGVDQAQLLAARSRSALMAGAVGEGRGAGAHDDGPNPQTFRDRPGLSELLASSAVGDDTAAEALPGRLYPLPAQPFSDDGAPTQGYPR